MMHVPLKYTSTSMAAPDVNGGRVTVHVSRSRQRAVAIIYRTHSSSPSVWLWPYSTLAMPSASRLACWMLAGWLVLVLLLSIIVGRSADSKTPGNLLAFLFTRGETSVPLPPAPQAPPIAVEPALDPGQWKCECGSVNSGKFCPNCGAKKPVIYRCDKCGWMPPDPANLPKFCPNCGDPFNEEDMV